MRRFEISNPRLVYKYIRERKIYDPSRHRIKVIETENHYKEKRARARIYSINTLIPISI